MEEKYFMLQIIDVTALQLALIRSTLANLVYVEIDNTFFISCTKSFKNNYKSFLLNKNINFILTYVNIKTGGDFESNGLNQSDKNTLEKIILPKK